MEVRTGTDPLELGTIFETLAFLELKFITYLHEYAIVDCKMQTCILEPGGPKLCFLRILSTRH